jgi:chain length determinant protein EpsF
MNLIQLLMVLQARIWVVLSIFLVAVATTTLVTVFMLPNEYTATTSVVVDSKAKDPFTGQLLPIQLLPGYMATQTDIILSRKVALKVVDNLKLVDSPGAREQFMKATKGKGNIRDWFADLLLLKLKVQPSRESSVIEIGFKGSDPQFAAVVANEFAKSFIETSLELRLVPAKQTAEWFDQQITQLRLNLDQAQQKLTAYQREKGIVESDERLDVETRRMSELAAQMVGAQSAAFDATSRTSDSGNLPEVTNNPVVQGYKAQVAQGEGRLADLAKRVGVNHPDYKRAQAEVNTYKAKLAAELSTATRGVGATAGAARQRVNDLSRAFEQQKVKMLGLKQQREEATLLARDLENAQRIYDAALQRYGQSRMEAQSTQTDVAVLNPAIPPSEKSSPKTVLNIVLSAVLGLILGMAAALLLEMLDRRVRSGLDIAGVLEIPVLAEFGGSNSWFAFLRRMFTSRRLLRA